MMTEKTKKPRNYKKQITQQNEDNTDNNETNTTSNNTDTRNNGGIN